MILVVDNYDSFTWNLVHYLAELGARVIVRRNDVLSADAALALGAEAMESLSPRPLHAGPGGDLPGPPGQRTPEPLPILGVCLGHQSIAQAFGGQVVRAKSLMHGKTSPIHHDGKGLFRGLPDPFTATRYHSLAAPREYLPEVLKVTAWTEDGEVMGLRHVRRPIFGVQFHPESIATEGGHQMLANFLDLAGVKRRPIAA